MKRFYLLQSLWIGLGMILLVCLVPADTLFPAPPGAGSVVDRPRYFSELVMRGSTLQLYWVLLFNCLYVRSREALTTNLLIGVVGFLTWVVLDVGLLNLGSDFLASLKPHEMIIIWGPLAIVGALACLCPLSFPQRTTFETWDDYLTVVLVYWIFPIWAVVWVIVQMAAARTPMEKLTPSLASMGIAFGILLAYGYWLDIHTRRERKPIVLPDTKAVEKAVPMSKEKVICLFAFLLFLIYTVFDMVLLEIATNGAGIIALPAVILGGALAIGMAVSSRLLSSVALLMCLSRLVTITMDDSLFGSSYVVGAIALTVFGALTALAGVYASFSHRRYNAATRRERNTVIVLVPIVIASFGLATWLSVP